MRRWTARAGAIAGLLIVAGCGLPPEKDAGPAAASTPAAATSSPAESGGSGTLLGPRAALPERLLGRSFTTRGPGDVSGIDLVAGSALTISFADDLDGGTSTIGANAGCNSMGGPVSWHDGVAQPIDGFARTEMACAGLMEQEDWYFALLNAGPTFSLDGDYLTVTGPNGTDRILFADSRILPPDPGSADALSDAPVSAVEVPLASNDNPLLGETFTLTRTFTDGGGANRMHPDASLSLIFGESRVSAVGSCGQFTYDDVHYLVDTRDPTLRYVDLGAPSASGCILGDDPGAPPADKLMFDLDGGEMWLSTGFVAWYFRAVG